MSDVLLFQTNNDGDISVVNGVTELTDGFETAAYLSLFGGNESDGDWWGNIGETDPAQKYISETQKLIQSIPAVSSNLLRLEEAAKSDLQWFLDKNIASSVDIFVTIPQLNRVRISGTIKAEGKEESFEFTENWKSLI